MEFSPPQQSLAEPAVKPEPQAAEARRPRREPRIGDCLFDASGKLASKEPLLVGTASLALGLYLFLLCVTVFRNALHRRLMQPMRFSQSGADEWALRLNGGRSGFFIDIGAFGPSQVSNTKLLEAHGWQGVCVDPVPTGFVKRECGTVPRPITLRDGDRVSIPRCLPVEEQQQADSRLRAMPCSETQQTGISFGFLLRLVEPPEVIDFVSIGVRKSGLEILQGFPWSQYCVRSWSVEHNDEESVKMGLRKLLTSNGCHVAQGVADTWALCSCSGGRADGDSSGGLPRGLPRAARRLPGLA